METFKKRFSKLKLFEADLPELEIPIQKQDQNLSLSEKSIRELLQEETCNDEKPLEIDF